MHYYAVVVVVVCCCIYSLSPCPLHQGMTSIVLSNCIEFVGIVHCMVLHDTADAHRKRRRKRINIAINGCRFFISWFHLSRSIHIRVTSMGQ